MKAARIFLDWSRPLPVAAAAWLAARPRTGGVLDLSNLLLVAPGRRVGRRIRERLAERSDAFLPPETVTLGELPGRWAPAPLPAATDLERCLAWAEALRAAPPDLRGRIFSGPMDADGVAAWIPLAREIDAAVETLSREGVSPRDAARAGGGASPARWESIAEIHDATRAILANAGRSDSSAPRGLAAPDAAAPDREVVLVGCADLPGRTVALLSSAARAGARITALVFAPEAEADAFDEWGGLRTVAWRARRVAPPIGSIVVAERPADAAAEVVRAVERAPIRPASQVSILVADASLEGITFRWCEAAGIPVRPSRGARWDASRPGRLLAAWSGVLRSLRADDFAALLGHPDLAAALDRDLGAPERDRLAALDEVRAERLLDLLSPAVRLPAPLGAALDWIAARRPAAGDDERPLGAWIPAVREILRAIYGASTWSPSKPEELRTARALEICAAALAQIERIPPSLGGRVDFAAALSLLVSHLADRPVPCAEGEDAVEAIGWLDSFADAAPRLIIVGAHAGVLPSGRGDDALLPDALRTALGLADRDRRWARDAYFLTSLLASRPEVTFVASRLDAAENPVVPSPLLLAAPDEELPARVTAFLPVQAPSASRPPRYAAGTNSLRAPRPDPLLRPKEPLSVTAFRAYLACPYRFYLRYVLRLEAIDPPGRELDERSFGSLVHEVLLACDLETGDPGPGLREELRRRLADRFGRTAPPAVAVQERLLDLRWDAFARWQSEETRAGWKILAREVPLEANLSTPDGPLRIRGKIDRIDRHADGRIRILDYKTGDAGKSPEKAHRVGHRGSEKTWIDLQLPLYRRLVLENLGNLQIDPGVPIETGYLLLPMDPEKTGWVPAKWEDVEYEKAEALARETAGRILAGDFWPPGEPAYADDPWAPILCAEASW